jgi:hypothetical protein
MSGTCECGKEISGCGDWMELGQDRDRLRAIVSTVKNSRFVGTGWRWLRIGTVGGLL